MGWLNRWKAQRAYAKLVEQERAAWRTVETRRIKCVMTDEGRPDSVYGWAAFAAQENGLGERRVRVLSMPKPWCKSDFETYATMSEWAAKAQSRAVPRKELA